jgi:hypothetical protein
MYDTQTSPQVPQIHLYVLPLTGDRKPMPFVNTEFVNQQGQFSPNGRWLAYRSMESGRSEVYVQGFTLDSAQPRGKWQISTAGGEIPRWRRDGKELFYRYGSTFFAVDVKTDCASFEVGIPRPLFDPAAVSNSRVTRGTHMRSPGMASGSWFSHRLRGRPVRHWRCSSTGDSGPLS